MSCLRNLKIKLKDMETEECSFEDYLLFAYTDAEVAYLDAEYSRMYVKASL